MSDLDELRRELAVEHGLDPAVVAKLVVGSTVAEIETSVDKLAALIGSGDTQQTEHDRDPLSAALARAPIEKESRQRALRASLHGQPRDQAGRWAARGSFDGGARTSVPEACIAAAASGALALGHEPSAGGRRGGNAK